MDNEIKINKSNKSIMFVNNGIAFEQFGIADEILDLITNLQEEIQKKEAMYDSLAVDYRLSQEENERLNNIINEYTKLLEAHLDDEFYWFKMYSKLQELKGSDK